MKKSAVFVLELLILAACGTEKHRDLDVPRDRSVPLPMAWINSDLGIPYIDLAFDTARQFVLDRAEGVYFGHPTTTKVYTPQGTERILAVYPLGGHARGITTMRSTDDGGRTWSDRIPGATALGKIQEVPTLHRLVDPAGRERLLLFTGLYPVRYAVSENQGQEWTPYRPAGDWGGIVTMSDLIPLKKNPGDIQFDPGRYAAFFHDDGRFISGSGNVYRDPVRFILYKTETQDGGLSWSWPEVIREDSMRMICEPGLVRSPDGTSLAMLLRENSRNFPSQVIFSTDEGQTWSDPAALPRTLCGDRHVLRYAADGRLVVVFRDVQPRFGKGPTEGDVVAWVGTWDDLYNGRLGHYRVRLLKNYHGDDAGYAGLELLDDGQFLAVTYLQYRLEDRGNNSVVAVRFGLQELDGVLKEDTGM
jgi:hypothetical protein